MLETTIAGSLPKPAWLAEPEQLWAAWRFEGKELDRAKRDAAMVWLKEQEAAGIDIVSDGDEVRFTRAYTRRKLKFTLPGPMTICDTIADAHYGRRSDMAMAFAEILNQEARELEAAGVDVIQLDEPAFNVFMGDVKEWGIAAMHRAIEGLRCTTAVHICYGYGIEANIRWKQTLGAEWRQYEEIFPALNASRIGQVSLECANSHVPLLLLGLLPDKEILLGAIDVATARIETPEQVADVIRQATAYLEPDRILPCTNCGMAPLPRAVAIGKLRALGAGAALARLQLG